MPRARATALSSYHVVARAVGLDPYELLKRAGIRPSSLENPEEQLAVGPMFELLEASAEQSNCPTFGLLMAEERSTDRVGALMLLLKQQQTARDLIGSIVRYQGLLAEALMVSAYDEDGMTSIHVDLVGAPAKRQAIEFVVATVHRVFSSIIGSRWCPDRLYFVHSAPKDLSVHHRIFRCPVAFGSTFNGFSASTASLDVGAEGEESFLAPYAARYLDSLGSSRATSVSERVRCSLYALLPRGEGTLSRVAEDLAVPPRSLQRLIAQDGQSFAALLDGVRRELALRYLGDPERDMTSVALSLGYSTPSSFNRWFLSEFGMTPTAWRAVSSSKALQEAT